MSINRYGYGWFDENIYHWQKRVVECESATFHTLLLFEHSLVAHLISAGSASF